MSVQKVKGQGHRGHPKFLSCPFHGSVAIWLIWFMLGTNIFFDMTMCRDPFSGQKVKGQGHASQLTCPLHGSIPNLLSPFICGIHNTWRDDVSRTIFRVKGQWVKLSRVVRNSYSVSSVAPSFFHRLTSYSLLASEVNPAMVSTARFYDRNDLYGSPNVRNCRMPNFLGWAFFVISLISIN